ncbi:MAG TPA: two-component regulator propeller domain-containing protein [Anaerolineales bacterium]|nr:two-component regulator propeller domain-containing protein [Anaerolineales bacterium]
MADSDMARIGKNLSFKLIATLLCLNMIGACQSVAGENDSTMIVQKSTQSTPPQIAHPISLLHPSGQGTHWVSYTNIDDAAQIALDPTGNIWTAGQGGVVRWDSQNKTYQIFTTSDGLPENYVTALAVAPDNKIWVGTHSGYIAEYDGNSWTTIKRKPGDIISCLAIAPDGAVWIGTNRGIDKFDGKNWNTYTTQQGILDNYIQSIAVTSTGKVWLGMIGGVSSFDGTIWKNKRLEKGKSVSGIIEAPDKTVWFESGDALVHFDGRQWKTFVTKGAFGSASSLAISPNGEVWLAGLGSGLVRFDENELRFIEYPIPDILCMAFSEDGALWLGGYRWGILHFNGKALDSYKAQDEPIGNSIISGAAASDGSLWFGTDQGASRFDGEHWKNYTTADGLSNNIVLSIAAAPDGAMWFGTEDGISTFNKGSWRSYKGKDGLTDRRILALAVTPDGTVWANSQTSLFRLDGDLWTAILPPASESIQTIGTRIDGGMWIATTNGLSGFDGQNWISIVLPVRAPILHIVQTGNRDLWIETMESGLFFISGQLWDQVSPENTQVITLDSDGLVKTSNASGNSTLNGRLWAVYGLGNGIPGNEIRAIAPGQDDNVWVVTDQGIFRPTDESWTNYSGPIMVGPDRFSPIVVDQQGSIWIGIPLGGLAKFTP